MKRRSSDWLRVPARLLSVASWRLRSSVCRKAAWKALREWARFPAISFMTRASVASSSRVWIGARWSRCPWLKADATATSRPTGSVMLRVIRRPDRMTEMPATMKSTVINTRIDCRRSSASLTMPSIAWRWMRTNALMAAWSASARFCPSVSQRAMLRSFDSSR